MASLTAVSAACPAFSQGCPFSSENFLTVAKNCPAFKEACPFVGVKHTAEIQGLLEKMPASHTDKKLPSGAAVDSLFSTLHQNSAAMSLSMGTCPVFSNGCPFRTTCSSGRPLLSELDAAKWGVAILDQTQKERLSVYLKTQTREVHSAAENVPFIRDFAQGILDRGQYIQLLIALYHVYVALEEALDTQANHPVLRGIYFPAELARLESLELDLEYFLGAEWRSRIPMSPCTKDYVQRIRDLSTSQPVLLLSHAYTRYLGDLSGGQALRIVAVKALQLPGDGPGTAFYRFDNIASPREFKQKYRAAMDATGLSPRIADAVAQEAGASFLFNIRIFQEIGAGPVLPLPAPTLLASGVDVAASHAAAHGKEGGVCPFAAKAPVAAAPTAEAAAEAGPDQCPFPFILMHAPRLALQLHPIKTAVLALGLAYALSGQFGF
eukprot:m.234076 g.234076  ORF g.234076 m.234076 type:complete len:437 (+) comp12609_c0_seq1:170-1480(+)